MEQFKSKSKVNYVRLEQVLIFNNAVCYTQLHMYIEALSSLQSIEKMEIYRSKEIIEKMDNLKGLIFIKMGRPCRQISNTRTHISTKGDSYQCLDRYR